MTGTKTFVHHKLEGGDKENKEDVIVYRSDNGNITAMLLDFSTY